MTTHETDRESNFDNIDTEIINILSRDGRTTNRAIGKLLEISPRLVASRVEKLIGSSLLKIVAMVDMHAAGYDLVISIGIKTAGQNSREVAEALSKFDEVISVLLMAGEYNIELLVLAENHEKLAQFVEDKMFEVSGIQSISVALALQIEKLRFSWAPFVSKVENGLDIAAGAPLDAVNKGILGMLWQDASMPYQAIAAKLDSSESNVRSRIMQMKEMSYIQISGVTNMNLFETDILAFVEIWIERGSGKALIKKLGKIKNVVFISVMLGRCDILVMVVAKNVKQLSHRVTDTIEKMPGVVRVRTSQRMETIKHDPRWARITHQKSL